MSLLLTLSYQFFLISLIAIGGVSATLPEIHRVFVENLHLMNNQQFAQLYALSQAAPGPNLLFVGLFGWQMAGFLGSVVSLVSLCGPTLAIAIVFEKIGAQYHDALFYRAMRIGLAPVAIGLLLSTAVLLIRSQFNWKFLIFTGLNIFIMIRWKMNSIYLIIAGAAVGAFGILN